MALGHARKLLPVIALLAGCFGGADETNSRPMPTPVGTLQQRAAAIQLHFAMQPPASVSQGESMTVQVVAIDGSSQVDTTANHVVTLELTPPVGFAPVQLPLASGVALFTGLTINLPAAGLAFVASASGLTSATSTSFEVLDTTPPATTLTRTPPALAATDWAIFEFAANEASTFECALDLAAFSACNSGTEYGGLAEGAHRFRVRATDSAGNVEATPVQFEWTVDLSGPMTTLVQSPDASTQATEASFAFTAEAGSTFECSFLFSGTIPCTSPVRYGSLVERGYSFSVQARDVAGNYGPKLDFYWTVDRSAPDTWIPSGPPAVTSETGATFAFSSESGALFECSVDGASFASCAAEHTVAALSEQPHRLLVRAVDAAGNVDTTPAVWLWTIDTTSPETHLLVGPASLSVSNVARFEFASEAGATFECSLDGSTFEVCLSGDSIAGLAVGTHLFKVRARDVAGNVDPTPAERSWEISAAPLLAWFDAAPPSTTNSSVATFNFSGSGASFECALDGAPFTRCVSPVSYAGLSEGQHLFSVRALDEAGTAGSATSQGWSVDATAPETQIVTGPAATSAIASEWITFSSSDPGARFECSLDNSGFSACRSPWTASVGDQVHLFLVRAIDAAGNVDPTPARLQWTLDSTAPDTVLTEWPPERLAARDATFSFQSEPFAILECSLDGAPFTTCVSPLSLTALADGGHTFAVRARDPLGNVDPYPATHAWSIELGTFVPVITAKPPAWSPSTSTSIAFACPGAVSFNCSLDGSFFTNCTSPKSLTGLTEGGHTFSVRARDGAGAEGATVTFGWTVDITRPSLAFLAQPPAATPDRDAVFLLSSDSQGARFECLLDAAPSGFQPCGARTLFPGLADGSHTLRARAIDAAGNTSPEQTATWRVDTIPPTTVITPPPALTNQTSVSIAFASPTASSFECSVDNAAFASCSSPYWTWGLSEGRHTFEVRAIDAAGNVEPAPPEVSWLVDVTGPETTLVAPAAGATRSTEISFSFTTEAGASFECRLDGTQAPCSSPVRFGGLSDGSHSFAVWARDPAGNTGPERSFAWSVDGWAPETWISSGPPAVSVETTATFALGSEADVGFECALDDAAFAPCAVEASFDSLTAGPHHLLVRAVDPAGNEDLSPAAWAWVVDQSPPQTRLLTQPPSLVNSSIVTFGFASEPNASFECSLDGASFEPCATGVEYRGLANGTHSFAVRTVDAAGNIEPTPAIASWEIDATAVVPAVESGPTLESPSTVATFAFALAEATAFECALDSAAFGRCASPATFTALAEGPHTFSVRAIGASQVAGPETTFAWSTDVSAPDTVITAGPASLTRRANAAILFESESGARFECSLDNGGFQECTSPWVASVSDSLHRLRVRAVDAAGNADPTPAQWLWTVDSTAAETHPTESIPDRVTSSDARFAFTSEPDATYECSLDGAPFATCTSPRLLAGLADGGHTFAVRARDAAGNVDAAHVFHRWSIEPTALIATLRGPSGGPLSTWSRSTASFSLTCPAGATCLCSRNNGSTKSSCAAAPSYSGLQQGQQSLMIWARDAVGTEGPPVTFNWVVDTTAPTASLQASVATATPETEAVFFISASEAGSRLQCSFGGGGFADCASRTRFPGLAEGSHSLSVRAVDAAGNIGLPSETFLWTVDFTPPETALTRSPRVLSNESPPPLEASSESGASFECSLDGGAFVSCSSQPYYGGLPDGSHGFRIRAVDAAGNFDPTPAACEWTQDLKAPETTLGPTPTDPTGSSTASFTFDSEPGASFECSLDWVAAPCTSPRVYSSLGHGQHRFSVRAIDAAGNGDPSPSEYVWTVDLEAPDAYATETPPSVSSSTSASVSFTAYESAVFECSLDGAPFSACVSPATYAQLGDGVHTLKVHAIDSVGNVGRDFTVQFTVDTAAPDTTLSSQPPASTNAQYASFAIESEAGTSFECSLDGSAWAPCYAYHSVSSLAEGQHALRARATDAAGNVDPTPVEAKWAVDLTAPETSLDQAPPVKTSATSVSIAFSSEAGATFECLLAGSWWQSCSSPFEATGLSEGTHSFSVRAKDAAGNDDPSPESVAWEVDLTGPEVEVTQAPSGVTTSTSAAFVIQCYDPSAAIECSLDGGPFTACTSLQTYTGLGEGEHRFTARAVDSVGNLGGASPERIWRIDLTPPETTLVSQPAPTTEETCATLAFTSEPLAGFQCAFDEEPWSSCSSPASRCDLGEGPHSFSVRAADQVGNVDATPATASWQVDIRPAGAPRIVREANLKAAVGKPYAYSASGAVTASGISPIQYEFCADAAGAALDRASGSFVWTPTVAGPVAFCVLATNTAGDDRYDFTVQVEATPPPTSVDATFTASTTTGNVPLSVTFDALASSGDPIALPLLFWWDLGDGNPPATTAVATTSYVIPGVYHPRLIVTDAFGVTDEFTMPIEVRAPDGSRPPSAKIGATVTPGPGTASVALSDLTTAGGARIVSIRWDLGNGEVREGASATATYGPGTWRITLTALDEAGLSSSDAFEVIVPATNGDSPPTCRIFAEPAGGVVPLSVTWNALARSESGATLSFRWDFGSGQIASGVRVARFYSQPGWYGATLTVTDSKGLTCTDSLSIAVQSALGLPPRILSEPNPRARCGQPYQYGDSLPLAQGAGPIQWSANSAPAGLSVNSGTGAIHWTPTAAQAGTQHIVLVAQNDAGSDRQSFDVEVECEGVTRPDAGTPDAGKPSDAGTGVGAQDAGEDEDLPPAVGLYGWSCAAAGGGTPLLALAPLAALLLRSRRRRAGTASNEGRAGLREGLADRGNGAAARSGRSEGRRPQRGAAGALMLAAALTALAGSSRARAAEPPKQLPSIIVLGIESSLRDDSVDAQVLTEVLVNAVDERGWFRVISPKDLSGLLSLDKQKQALGCTDDSCMAEVAGALGADTVLSANVGKVGDSLVVSARLIDAKRARAISRASRESPSANDLLRSVRYVGEKIANAFYLQLNPGAILPPVAEPAPSVASPPQARAAPAPAAKAAAPTAAQPSSAPGIASPVAAPPSVAAGGAATTISASPTRGSQTAGLAFSSGAIAGMVPGASAPLSVGARAGLRYEFAFGLSADASALIGPKPGGRFTCSYLLLDSFVQLRLGARGSYWPGPKSFAAGPALGLEIPLGRWIGIGADLGGDAVRRSSRFGMVLLGEGVLVVYL